MTTSQANRIGKLYEGLTPAEKAAAVFACLTRLDTTTADRIVATVATKTYRTLDMDYSQRLSRLGDMATFWGLRYWREMFRMTAALGMMNHAWRSEKEELAAEAFECFQNAQGRLVALDAMLKDLCDAHGIDAAAVRTLADVDGPWEPVGEPPPDASFETEIRGILEKLVG
jgi:hypothetical protein